MIKPRIWQKTTVIMASVLLLSTLSVAAPEQTTKDAKGKSPTPAYPAAWKTLDVEGLAKVAHDLDKQKKKEKKNIRAQKSLLASYISREYKRLSGEKTDSKAWLEVARRLGGSLSRKTKEQLSRDIVQRHLADDKTIAAYSFNELNQYASAIFALGQEKTASTVWAKWTVLSDRMPSLSGKNLVRLASWIRYAGKAGPEANKRIIQQVTEHFLKNEASVQKLSTSNWRSLAAHLNRDMNSKTRVAWAEKIKAAYVKKDMNLGGVLDVENALAIMRLEAGRGFLFTWTEGKTWTKWSGEHIARLASRLGWDDPKAKHCREAIISHFENKIFGEEKKTQAVRGKDWLTLVESVRQDLSSDQRNHWAQRIRESFLAKPMGVSELVHVESALNALKLLAGQYFTYDWAITNEPMWQKWPGKDLSILAVHLAGNAPQAEVARGKLVEFVEKKYLVNSKAAMAIEDKDWRRYIKAVIPYMKRKQVAPWAKVLGDMMIARNIKKGVTPNGMKDATGVMFEFTDTKLLASFIQKWGMKVYNATLGTPKARESVDIYTLSLVGEGIHLAKWNNTTKDFPEYAEALASLVAKGKISGDHHWEHYYYWAAPLSLEKNRLKVRESLLDKQGRPHMGAVLILACAYRDHASLKDWLSYLETLINAPDIDADTKAYRLLARGLAQGMEWKRYAPWRGRAWLDHAMATAETDAVRLDIARQVVKAYLFGRDYEGALAMLDRISANTSKEVAKALTKDRRDVLAQARQAEIKEQQRLQRAEFKVSRSHRATLEKRLADARAKGKPELIRRYEKLLQKSQ